MGYRRARVMKFNKPMTKILQEGIREAGYMI